MKQMIKLAVAGALAFAAGAAWSQAKEIKIAHVYDKTGVVTFARGLVDLGFEIVASGDEGAPALPATPENLDAIVRDARARGIGWRLDYFLVSEALVSRVKDVIIHENVMGSDHCPVELVLD